MTPGTSRYWETMRRIREMEARDRARFVECYNMPTPPGRSAPLEAEWQDLCFPLDQDRRILSGLGIRWAE